MYADGMKIYRIESDYFPPTNDGQPGDFTVHEIGVNKVIKIEDHPAMGEGDRWFWTVYFEDEHQEIIFNIHRVYKIPERNSNVADLFKTILNGISGHVKE